jgi:hypothetical protein
MGLCLVGHHPIHSQGRLFQRSGPERSLQIRVPALSTTRPMGFVCLLTNELLSSFLRGLRLLGGEFQADLAVPLDF